MSEVVLDSYKPQGVTHCGEHLLLLLGLSGCVWVFSVTCATSCPLSWHHSEITTAGTFETPHSAAKHERGRVNHLSSTSALLCDNDLSQKQRPGVVPQHVSQHMIYAGLLLSQSWSAVWYITYVTALMSYLEQAGEGYSNRYPWRTLLSSCVRRTVGC